MRQNSVDYLCFCKYCSLHSYNFEAVKDREIFHGIFFIGNLILNIVCIYTFFFLLKTPYLLFYNMKTQIWAHIEHQFKIEGSRGETFSMLNGGRVLDNIKGLRAICAIFLTLFFQLTDWTTR